MESAWKVGDSWEEGEPLGAELKVRATDLEMLSQGKALAPTCLGRSHLLPKQVDRRLHPLSVLRKAATKTPHIGEGEGMLPRPPELFKEEFLLSNRSLAGSLPPLAPEGPSLPPLSPSSPSPPPPSPPLLPHKPPRSSCPCARPCLGLAGNRAHWRWRRPSRKRQKTQGSAGSPRTPHPTASLLPASDLHQDLLPLPSLSCPPSGYKQSPSPTTVEMLARFSACMPALI